MANISIKGLQTMLSHKYIYINPPNNEMAKIPKICLELKMYLLGKRKVCSHRNNVFNLNGADINMFSISNFTCFVNRSLEYKFIKMNCCIA